MPTFEQGDIVRVPFPYTDRSTRQRPPSLVVSCGAIGPASGLLWVVMITSAKNSGWASDCDLGPDFRAMGLPIRSIARPAKIATIETRDAEPIGKVDHATLRVIRASLERIFAPA